jgi:hypothetical protein
MEVDFELGMVRLPQDKLARLLSFLQKIATIADRARSTNVLTIRRLLGQLEFASMACPWVHAGMHRLEQLLAAVTPHSQQQQWHSQHRDQTIQDQEHTAVKLNAAVRDDLRFIIMALQERNGVTFELDTELVAVAVDASSTGFGGVALDSALLGHFAPSQAMLHINVKELLALQHRLSTPSGLLANRQLIVYYDNVVAAAYARRGGGRVQNLDEIARHIWRDICWQHNILIRRVVYVPSAENVEADRLSRLLSEINSETDNKIRQNEMAQDWGLSKEAYGFVER